jgi:hypothetical protein
MLDCQARCKRQAKHTTILCNLRTKHISVVRKWNRHHPIPSPSLQNFDKELAFFEDLWEQSLLLVFLGIVLTSFKMQWWYDGSKMIAFFTGALIIGSPYILATSAVQNMLLQFSKWLCILCCRLSFCFPPNVMICYLGVYKSQNSLTNVFPLL